ncbi:MAG: nuclear transport factor 2 family protein [Thermodesulfobacteriota bacterium]
MTEAEARALFERRRDAWLANDLDAYLALFSEGLVFQSPSHPEPLRGWAAFAELVRRSAAAIEPRSFDFSHLAVTGDVVLAEWRITARHRPTGRPIEWWGMSVCRVRDGLIESWREYWNPADVAAAREP